MNTNSEIFTSFSKKLAQTASSQGVAVFGIADLTELQKKVVGLLDLVLGNYVRAVVVGLRLQRTVLESIVDKPTPLYFHHYRQVNYQLDRVALLLADLIQRQDYLALAIPASQIIIREPMSGHISHKLLGWAAGLGFIGRNTLLINPQYGAQLRYVSVLTNMPLVAGKPLSVDCGDCHECQKVCPAAAIGEEKSEFKLESCYQKLTEFSKIPYVSQHICGVCVKACKGSHG